jgi:hypothetical protein
MNAILLHGLWYASGNFGDHEGKTVDLSLASINAVERSDYKRRNSEPPAATATAMEATTAKSLVYSFWATPGSNMTKLQADLLQKPSVFVGNDSHACYAELHNYDYRFELIPNTALVDASEARTAALLRIFGDGRGGQSSQLKDGSWLMYADADTYIIDPDRSMESMINAAHDMQATRMAAAKISVGAGANDGCDLIIQEDGATGDPGANAGWFLLRNSEWSRGLLERWANTRKARKGDYVQIRQSSGGDDQPALMDLIIHEASKAGGVAYADT